MDIQIKPEEILQAFNKAKLMISMSEGPMGPMSSFGNPYLVLTHAGIAGDTNRDWLIRQCSMEAFIPLLKQLYLDQLVDAVKMFGGGNIEWRTWPEINVRSSTRGAVYSRLSIYGEMQTKDQHKMERQHGRQKGFSLVRG
jgi:hypothetical protein